MFIARIMKLYCCCRYRSQPLIHTGHALQQYLQVYFFLSFTEVYKLHAKHFPSNLFYFVFLLYLYYNQMHTSGPNRWHGDSCELLICSIISSVYPTIIALFEFSIELLDITAAMICSVCLNAPSPACMQTNYFLFS